MLQGMTFAANRRSAAQAARDAAQQVQTWLPRRADSPHSDGPEQVHGLTCCRCRPEQSPHSFMGIGMRCIGYQVSAIGYSRESRRAAA